MVCQSRKGKDQATQVRGNMLECMRHRISRCPDPGGKGETDGYIYSDCLVSAVCDAVSLAEKKTQKRDRSANDAEEEAVKEGGTD